MRKIVSNPQICHGKPTFEGTRILVSVLLDSLADKVSVETLLKGYPELEEADIYEAIKFASSCINFETESLERATV